MLKNYLELLRKIFGHITGSSDGTVTVQDWLTAIGLGIGTILFIVALAAIISGTYFVPKFSTEKLFAKAMAGINEKYEALKELSDKERSLARIETDDLLRSLNRKIIVTRVALSILYVPVAIPTFLFVIDMIAGNWR